MKYSKALIYTPLSCTGLADARFCNWVQKSLKYMDLYSKNLKLHTFYDLALTLLVIQMTKTQVARIILFPKKRASQGLTVQLILYPRVRNSITHLTITSILTSNVFAYFQNVNDF